MRIFWLNLLNGFHAWRRILIDQMLSVLSFFYVKAYFIALIIINSLNWAVAFVINKNVRIGKNCLIRAHVVIGGAKSPAHQ